MTFVLQNFAIDWWCYAAVRALWKFKGTCFVTREVARPLDDTTSFFRCTGIGAVRLRLIGTSSMARSKYVAKCFGRIWRTRSTNRHRVKVSKYSKSHNLLRNRSPSFRQPEEILAARWNRGVAPEKRFDGELLHFFQFRFSLPDVTCRSILWVIERRFGSQHLIELWGWCDCGWRQTRRAWSFAVYSWPITHNKCFGCSENA